jgi:hypothetical protein
VSDEILYLIGSFIIGLLFFSLAYKLIMANIKQSQNQNVLDSFESLYNEINYVCESTGNYGLGLNYEIYPSVKLVYATEDPNDFEAASAFVDTTLYSRGKNLCIVFKDEEAPRCKKLKCNVVMPYIGSFDVQDDFQLFVNKILGKKLVKKYKIYLQNYGGRVIISKDEYVDFSQIDFNLNYNDYVFLFIQLNDKVDGFEEKAKEISEKWKEKTPLNKCQTNVKIITLPEVCNVPDQQGICDGDPQTYFETLYSILDCASKSNYFGFYDRIIGFVKDEYVCQLPQGSVEGYAFGYGTPVIVSQKSYLEIAIHELGHTYGLCDEGYGSGADPRCESGYSMSGGDYCEAGNVCCPNYPEVDSIYCTWDKCNTGCTYAFNFAPSSYKHLEKELKKYCD